MDKRKKIVVLGGGNGSAVSLVALKQNIELYDITAIISMSDSGGSSGTLRKQLNTLPPGDIMRAVLALSEYDYLMLRDIFYQPRFENCGKLNTHNLGNLFLTLMSNYCGDFLSALNALSQSVKAQGKVYPVTLTPSDLTARLNDGQVIHTESFIDNPTYNRGLKIEKVWLEPAVIAFESAVKAIKEADYIIISPGSLYTSLISTLLPQGIFETIKVSSAKIIYIIGNSYRTDGETGPETLSGNIKQLERYLPRNIDLVLYNSHILNNEEREYYKKRKWNLFATPKEEIKNLLSLDLERSGGGMCAIKLGKKLKEILV